jgi:isoleucyl-tRNA synthetase
MELMPDVSKALEEKRGAGLIGSSFEAQIILLTNSEFRYKYLESLQKDLAEIFKVSRVNINNKVGDDSNFIKTGYPDISIVVSKAEGQKCIRCWNFSLSIGRSKLHPLICENCLRAIGEE